MNTNILKEIERRFEIRNGQLWNKDREMFVNNRPNSSGYIGIKILGKTVKMHRIVYYLAHGVWCDKDKVINHINHRRADNRVSNLEMITQKENIRAYHRFIDPNWVAPEYREPDVFSFGSITPEEYMVKFDADEKTVGWLCQSASSSRAFKFSEEKPVSYYRALYRASKKEAA